MTRERCKELLPVMTAWANGEGVQVRTRREGGGIFQVGPWADVEVVNPNFESENVEWRVKPKPREVWVNEYGTGLGGGAYATETIARSNSQDCTALGGYIKPILFREVLP